MATPTPPPPAPAPEAPAAPPATTPAATGPSAKPLPSQPKPHLLASQTLAQGERLLVEERATALFYFPLPLVFLLIVGAFISLSYEATMVWSGGFAVGFATFAFYVFIILFAGGLIWLFTRYLRWRSTVYAVTSRRVIVQKGILGHSFEEIPLLQVRGVNIKQSLGQRLLGYGTIHVSSEARGTVGNEDWVGIPKPMRFQQTIESAMQALQPGAAPPVAAPAAGAAP